MQCHCWSLMLLALKRLRSLEDLGNIEVQKLVQVGSDEDTEQSACDRVYCHRLPEPKALGRTATGSLCSSIPSVNENSWKSIWPADCEWNDAMYASTPWTDTVYADRVGTSESCRNRLSVAVLRRFGSCHFWARCQHLMVHHRCKCLRLQSNTTYYVEVCEYCRNRAAVLSEWVWTYKLIRHGSFLDLSDILWPSQWCSSDFNNSVLQYHLVQSQLSVQRTYFRAISFCAIHFAWLCSQRPTAAGMPPTPRICWPPMHPGPTSFVSIHFCDSRFWETKHVKSHRDEIVLFHTETAAYSIA